MKKCLKYKMKLILGIFLHKMKHNTDRFYVPVLKFNTIGTAEQVTVG